MDLSASKRITELDIAKGIGILLVVVGHVLPTEDYWRTLIYSFHMPLFFFLSGVVMKEPIENTAKDYVICDRKLIASYLFYSLIFFLFDIVAMISNLKQIGIKDLFWDIYQTVSLYGINVLWFISSLVLGKIIVKLALKKVSTSWKLIIVSVVTYFVLGVISNYMPSTGSGAMRLVYLPIATVIRTIAMSSFILSGYVLKGYVVKAIEKGKLFVCVVCGVVTFIILLWIAEYNEPIDYHSLQFGMVPLSFITGYIGICFVLCCSMIIVRIPYISNIVVFFGKNSLFIMVTHEYLMIKTLISTVISKLLPSIDAIYQVLMLIFCLLAIEAFMCKYVKLICDKCVGWIAGRIEII